MNRDESTYGKVAQKYDEWVDIMKDKPVPERVLPPQRPYTPEPEQPDMSKTVFAAIGIGIGVLLLALAGLSFYSASQWAALGRDGATTGYTVVGFFLSLAGLGGILATYNHNFRVLNRPAGHH